MAIHGKNTRLYGDKHDLSIYLTNSGLDKSIEINEITTYSKDDKNYIVGLKDATLSAEGVYDDDISTIDAILNDLEISKSVYSFYPGSDTKGNKGYGFEALKTSTNFSISVTDAVNFSLAGQTDNGTDRITSITPKVTLTDNGSTDSVDLSSGGANGGVLYYHIIAVTGTVTVTIEDSANNIDWATLHSIGEVSSEAGVRIKLSGNIDRYVRVTVSDMSSESITLQASIKVN